MFLPYSLERMKLQPVLQSSLLISPIYAINTIQSPVNTIGEMGFGWIDRLRDWLFGSTLVGDCDGKGCGKPPWGQRMERAKLTHALGV